MAVGPGLKGDGYQPTEGRYAKTLEAVVQQAHGKYYEAASRGALFVAADQGVGITVQVSLTTTAALTLHNPANSQKRLALKKLAISYFSGTLGAGSFYHGYLPPGNTLPSSGTALTSRCTCVGFQGSAAAVGVAISGATVVAGLVLAPFAATGPTLASTATPYPLLVEDIDGAICLEPGAQYQLLGVFGGAGSVPKISAGIYWEEIPIG